jgi:iron complex transport system ATP-binding protein
LDVEHQISIFEILAKLSEEQKLTTITVTHDLNIASLFAQNVLILHEGKIEKGKKEEILTENNINYYFHVNSKINFTDNYSTISILRK